MNLPQHGSNPHYLYESMHIIKPKNIIDFSANINPLGPPKKIQHQWSTFYQHIHDYPDPYALRLKTIIAKNESINEDSLLIGNGGAEIITLIGNMLAGKNVLIIEPAFSEYEQVCKKNGCTVFYHTLTEPDWALHPNKLDLQQMDAVFLCNPNNPTGVHYPLQTVKKLAEKCRQTDTYLIMDEAFYDFVADYQPTPSLLKTYRNLIIVRSMTKMFAIPGLRLGYVLAHHDIIKRLANYQAHWSVNTLAMLAGEICLQDEQFVKETIHYMQQERLKLFDFFHQQGFVISPSKINFYLLQEPDATEEGTMALFEFLLKKGLVPRHTYNFPGLSGKWLRFAIKGKEENIRLMEVLMSWKQRP